MCSKENIKCYKSSWTATKLESKLYVLIYWLTNWVSLQDSLPVGRRSHLERFFWGILFNPFSPYRKSARSKYRIFQVAKYGSRLFETPIDLNVKSMWVHVLLVTRTKGEMALNWHLSTISIERYRGMVQHISDVNHNLTIMADDNLQFSSTAGVNLNERAGYTTSDWMDSSSMIKIRSLNFKTHVDYWPHIAVRCASDRWGTNVAGSVEVKKLQNGEKGGNF